MLFVFFFYGFDETLQALFAETRDAPLARDPSQRSWLLHPTLNTERGSNAFAVAPARSGGAARVGAARRTLDDGCAFRQLGYAGPHRRLDP